MAKQDLKISLPELVTRNAFRILGLPSTTGGEFLTKLSQVLVNIRETSTREATPWDLPCLGPIPRIRPYADKLVALHSAALQGGDVFEEYMRRNIEETDAITPELGSFPPVTIGDVDNEDDKNEWVLSVLRDVGSLTKPYDRFLQRLFWFSEEETVAINLFSEQQSYNEKQLNSSLANANLHESALVHLIGVTLADPLVKDIERWKRVIGIWRELLTDEAYWQQVLETDVALNSYPPAIPEDAQKVKEDLLGIVVAELVLFAQEALAQKKDAACERVMTVLRDSELWNDFGAIVFRPFLENFIKLGKEIGLTLAETLKNDEEEASNLIQACQTAHTRYQSEIEPYLKRIKRFSPPGVEADKDDSVATLCQDNAAGCLAVIARGFSACIQVEKARKLFDQAKREMSSEEWTSKWEKLEEDFCKWEQENKASIKDFKKEERQKSMDKFWDRGLWGKGIFLVAIAGWAFYGRSLPLNFWEALILGFLGSTIAFTIGVLQAKQNEKAFQGKWVFTIVEDSLPDILLAIKSMKGVIPYATFLVGAFLPRHVENFVLSPKNEWYIWVLDPLLWVWIGITSAWIGITSALGFYGMQSTREERTALQINHRSRRMLFIALIFGAVLFVVSPWILYIPTNCRTESWALTVARDREERWKEHWGSSDSYDGMAYEKYLENQYREAEKALWVCNGGSLGEIEAEHRSISDLLAEFRKSDEEQIEKGIQKRMQSLDAIENEILSLENNRDHNLSDAIFEAINKDVWMALGVTPGSDAKLDEDFLELPGEIALGSAAMKDVKGMDKHGRKYLSLSYEFETNAEFEKASDVYEKILEIQRQTGNIQSPKILGTLWELAYVYREQGDFDNAVTSLREATELLAQGSELPVKERYKTLEESLRQTITKYWDWEGNPDHPTVAMLWERLGYIYFVQGQYDAARSAFAKSLGIREKVFGPDHLKVAHSLTALAKTHYEQGNYGRAESELQRAYEIIRKHLSPDHDLIVRNRKDYKDVLAKLGRDLG